MFFFLFIFFELEPLSKDQRFLQGVRSATLKTGQKSFVHRHDIFTPLDTGRKLNVHKTFRRRPGCLVNVLCTFNLRLVSRGKGLKRFPSFDFPSAWD